MSDLDVIGYVVMNENCVGYLFDIQGYLHVGILGSSIIKGGPNWKNGPVPVSEMDRIRAAKKADFEEFRVNSDGYNLSE